MAEEGVEVSVEDLKLEGGPPTAHLKAGGSAVRFSPRERLEGLAGGV